MPDESVSQRLQKSILVYSVAGMFVVGLVVALVGVLPLARQLRAAQRQNLLVSLQKQTLATEQFLTRLKRSATVSASRLPTRDRLEAYARGDLPRGRLIQELGGYFRESLATASNLVGVQVYDARTNLLVQAGWPIPPEHFLWPDPVQREPSFVGPFRNGDGTYLLAAAPVLSIGQQHLGTILILYRARALEEIVEDFADLGDSGETIIGSRMNKALPIFFPMRQARQGRPADPRRIAAVMEGLLRGAEKRSELFDPKPPMDERLVLAHGPVKGTDWGVVVCMDRKELLSATNRQLTLLGSVLMGLILLGAAGILLLLRPLAGRVILHTDELESQIYEKTAALNTELAERKRAEQSVRDSEALYHSLVDTLPINILRKDLAGRVTYGNRGYCERMGKGLDQLIGKTDYQLFPRELADKYCHDDEKVIQTGEMFEDVEEHRTGDGQRLYVHVLKAPVRDAAGKVVGTQVIFWDVTARKLAEEALEKTARELARSNQELEQFAYVASHDLQEPLRMITSYTQLIAKRYQEKLDTDAREFMRFAVDGAQRMQKLIQGLLQYSRVGTRGKPLEVVSCDQALDEAMANLKIALEETGAEITRDPLPSIMGDPIQLCQLFQNLLSNALKFRSPASLAIRISAERRARPDAASLNRPPFEWVFRVTDNGIGIEPQYFDRIFVIFQRLHTQDQYPGTGIGLAICRKIVERHAGRIWLESRPGAGTTFFFTFPALE